MSYPNNKVLKAAAIALALGLPIDMLRGMSEEEIKEALLAAGVATTALLVANQTSNKVSEIIDPGESLK